MTPRSRSSCVLWCSAPFVVYVLSNWQAYSSAGGGVDLEETHKVARSREINVGGGFGDFDDDEDRLFGNEFDDDLYVHSRDTVLHVLWSLTHAPFPLLVQQRHGPWRRQ